MRRWFRADIRARGCYGNSEYTKCCREGWAPRHMLKSRVFHFELAASKNSMTQFAKETLPISLEEEMRNSYLDYAMSVIVGRALPDARDGLKPVHRRVLFAMRELSNDWNRAYKKSARIVGDVIGKYHPHGDQSVLRHDREDGAGFLAALHARRRAGELRFGRWRQRGGDAIHRDPHGADRSRAARRYRQGNRRFRPQLRRLRKEPLVLPTRLPNLLINGSGGIAVGMATNIPPHNLSGWSRHAWRCWPIPDIDIEDLIRIVKAPDFPTAAMIYGLHGVREGYRTGRGRVIMRARTHFEDIGRGPPGDHRR